MNEYRRDEIGGLTLVGRMVAREGRRGELLQLLEEAVAVCGEHEPDGILSATFHVSPSNPDLVVLYEHYPSRAALDEHLANYERIPAYGEGRARLGELLAKPVEIVEAATPVVRFTREQASNPNLATMDAIRDAMRREDWHRLANFLHPGAALTLHGTGPLCGVFEGRAPFVAALQRLRSATAGVLRPEPVAVAASGDWVTSQIRVRGDREGRAIETLEFISYRFHDGLAVEAHFIPADQREFWEFIA